MGVGLMIHHCAPRLAERARRFTPLLSVLIVSLICGSIIGQTAATALSAGPVVCRPPRGTPAPWSRHAAPPSVAPPGTAVGIAQQHQPLPRQGDASARSAGQR